MNRFPGRVVLCFAGLVLSGLLQASPGVGECVVFREGGDGRLLKSPSYWVKGTLIAEFTERRQVGLCPVVAKPRSAYSYEERVRMALAAPCVLDGADIRELDVRRMRMLVESWETPWSHAHGSAGLLFRGAFLGQTLVKGGSIELAAEWLEPCEKAP